MPLSFYNGASIKVKNILKIYIGYFYYGVKTNEMKEIKLVTVFDLMLMVMIGCQSRDYRSDIGPNIRNGILLLVHL